MLTAKEIDGLKEPGRYKDQRGLFLRVRETGSKQWNLVMQHSGKTYDIALGEYPRVGLKAARESFEATRARIKGGSYDRDIEAAKTTPPPAVPTFEGVFQRWMKQNEEGFRNLKHRQQWKNTLRDYCGAIMSKPVSEITTDDIVRILEPIWSEKAETASRIRGRIERVLSAAKAYGHRAGENPAAWRDNLDMVLGKRKKLQRGHHAALPYKQMPDFWKRLSKLNSTSSAALRWTVLTAARSGETREARWGEIDAENRLWIVPAVRMKGGREHVVPLTEEALTILAEMRKLGEEGLIFPGARGGRPLSDMALTMCARGLVDGITVHGFRSTFRDWAGDETSHQREVAEAALAHISGDAVEQAYRRGTAIEKRKSLMSDWTDFVSGKNRANPESHTEHDS